MLNTANELNAWLKEQIQTLPEIYNDAFPTAEGDCIICRYDPSQSAERRFLDGGRYVVQQLAYYARSSDASQCRVWLDAIIQMLDLRDIIRVSDGLTVQCEAVTLPQFVEVDDKNQSFYTATVNVEYTEQPEQNGAE